MRVLYVLRHQIFKFKLRRFNISYYYCDIRNTKKFFIRIVKIVLIYNSQKKILYIVRPFQNLKFVHFKNKSFKNLHISLLYKLQLCKDRFLMRSIPICIYIILYLNLMLTLFRTFIYATLLIRDVAKTLLSTKLNVLIVVY